MTLKVQLVRDERIILELPLKRREWKKEALESELEEFESDLVTSAEMHDIFSSRVRAKMISEMFRKSDRRFSELMNTLDANQKIVSENLQRMVKKRLVRRIEKKPSEVHYVLSDLGFASMIGCMVMSRIMDELEEE
jgi:DNA-binding HxlR family transcriptional regulator